MNRVKKFYFIIALLMVASLASVAILGSLLNDNIGKDPDTILISLPSLSPEDNDETLNEWDFVSEMTLFGSVYSEDREKLIAPGMSNSTEIVIDNRNSGALGYEISFNFASSEEDFWIPLKVQITRYDGTLLTDNYVDVNELSSLVDTHDIGGDCYAYYLVEWYWPDGTNDSEIGNLALEKDVKIFASINAKTWKSEEQNVSHGVEREYEQEPVWQTVNIIVAVALAVCAFTTCTTLLRLENNYIDLEDYPLRNKNKKEGKW